MINNVTSWLGFGGGGGPLNLDNSLAAEKDAIARALSSPRSAERRAKLLDAIRSMSAGDRREFREKRKAELDAARDEELKALRERTTAAAEDHRGAVAELEDVLNVRDAEIDEAIAAELRERLYPLIKAFGEAPRATAREIAMVWSDLATRLKYETGRDLDSIHLVFAFVAAIGNENIIGCRRFYDSFICAEDSRCRRGEGALITAAAAACAANENAVHIDSCLRRLEEAVAGAMTGASTPSATVRSAHQRYASSALRVEAVERAQSSDEHKREIGAPTRSESRKSQEEAYESVLVRMSNSVVNRIGSAWAREQLSKKPRIADDEERVRVDVPEKKVRAHVEEENEASSEEEAFTNLMMKEDAAS
ncbi:MAG: hypothetical protein KIT84_26475 [Labilithrix sp.]|nr:hypothetical protein [Labilithrix sp.]MCW5814599.1 hypothetical protein [Labilithrix sp.]